MSEGKAFPYTDPPMQVSDPVGIEAGRGPRSFVEFPKHMHKPGGRYVVVNDIGEQQKAEQGGYREEAYGPDETEESEAPKREPRHPRGRG
jgi:hypothetical protein